MTADKTRPRFTEFVGYVGEMAEPNGPRIQAYFLADWADRVQARFEEWLGKHDAEVRKQVSAAPAAPDTDRLLALIRDLTDSDDCWFDHHGGCQAHGYLSLKPGELCPHAEAKQVLAADTHHHRKDT